MPRNVLVTGGAGYIGSHVCKALASSGYLPVTLDNLVHGHRWAVRWDALVEGNVGDRALVRRTLRAGDPAVLVAATQCAQDMPDWHAEQSSLTRIVETAWRWHAAHDPVTSTRGRAVA